MGAVKADFALSCAVFPLYLCSCEFVQSLMINLMIILMIILIFLIVTMDVHEWGRMRARGSSEAAGQSSRGL